MVKAKEDTDGPEFNNKPMEPTPLVSGAVYTGSMSSATRMLSLKGESNDLVGVEDEGMLAGINILHNQ